MIHRPKPIISTREKEQAQKLLNNPEKVGFIMAQ